jgi:hypothetical protein
MIPELETEQMWLGAGAATVCFAEGSCSKCSKKRAVCRYSKNSGNWYTEQQDDRNEGRVAQLGEHLLCKQGVAGSNPVTSTKFPKLQLVAVRRPDCSWSPRRRETRQCRDTVAAGHCV